MNKEESECFKDYKLSSDITVDEYGDSYFIETNSNYDSRAVQVKKDGTGTERAILKSKSHKFKFKHK